MADMTVEEIKQKKIDLEAEITKQVKEFEKKSGVRVSYMDIQREQPKSKKGSNDPETVMMDSSYEERPLKTVNMEIRFL